MDDRDAAIARLRAALEPFKASYEAIEAEAKRRDVDLDDSWCTDINWALDGSTRITVGNLRAARDALT